MPANSAETPSATSSIASQETVTGAAPRDGGDASGTPIHKTMVALLIGNRDFRSYALGLGIECHCLNGFGRGAVGGDTGSGLRTRPRHGGGCDDGCDRHGAPRSGQTD